MSLSFVHGVGALAHNNREYINTNVDVNRIKNNVDYKNETLEFAYEKCFGESVKRYNLGQKRSDRKIDDYLNQVRKSKNKEKDFYEVIIQIGDKDTTGVGTVDGIKAENILDAYAKSFQERNPNLYVFNMKMHLDESTPHLHVDYIPVAKGYKHGLDTRNSLTKAHQNMGISKGTGKKDNSTMKWQEIERDYLKGLCKSFSLNIKDKNVNREHLTVDEYKVQAEKVEQLYNANINQDMDEIVILKAPFSDKKIIDGSDLDKLIENAKINEFTKTQFDEKVNSIKGLYSNLQSKLENLEEKELEIGILRRELENKLVENRILSEKYLALEEKFNESKDNEAVFTDLVQMSLDTIQSVNVFTKMVNLNNSQEKLLGSIRVNLKEKLSSLGFDNLVDEVDKAHLGRTIARNSKVAAYDISNDYEDDFEI